MRGNAIFDMEENSISNEEVNIEKTFKQNIPYIDEDFNTENKRIAQTEINEHLITNTIENKKITEKTSKKIDEISSPGKIFITDKNIV